MKRIIIAIALFIVIGFSAQALGQGVGEGKSIKKRDPFVDLVDAAGRIRTEDELYGALPKTLPTAIILKGIIWDQKRPLAVINGKIYAEGAVISEGTVLEKILLDSVVLKVQDSQRIKIQLKKRDRKKEG